MQIRSMLASALSRYLAEPVPPSARVIPGAGLAIEVTFLDGVRKTRTFDPSSVSVELREGQVIIHLGTSPQAAWAFESSRKSDLEKLYRDVQNVLRGVSRAKSKLKPVLIGALVGLAVIVIGAPSKAPTAPVAPAVAAVPPQMPSGSPAVTPAQAVVTAEEAKLISALKGVKLPGSGPAYYVFSDPNCPFCKQLEKAVEAVSGYQPVVLPLGYKDGSRDLAAGVMCAADPAKEWTRAIAGTSTAKPCEKGYKLVEANMQAFEKLGLSSTPTMVTPKGTLVTGSATAEELQAVLQR